MPPTRAIDGSRVSEGQRIAGSRRALGAAQEASFPAVLDNAAAAAEAEPPVIQQREGAASATAASPPFAGSAQRPGPRDLRTAGSQPALAPAAGAGRAIENGLDAAVDRFPSPAVAAQVDADGTATAEPDAAAAIRRPGDGEDGGKPAGTAPPAHTQQARDTASGRDDTAVAALAAALLIPGVSPKVAAPIGEPAAAAVLGDNAAKGVAGTGQQRVRDQAPRDTGPAPETERDAQIAAPAQISLDPTSLNPAPPSDRDDGSSIGLELPSAANSHSRSTVDGTVRVDPKLPDSAPSDAQTLQARADPGELSPLSHLGGSAAHDHGSLAAATAATAGTGTPPAAPATADPSSGSAAALSPRDIPDQLLGSVMHSMQNPDQDVTLRLHPPELGDLTIRVTVSGREVSAWFGTPQAQVQQVISQAIGQLHTDLGNAGYDLVGAWVGADASDPRERNSRLPSPQQRDPIAAAATLTSPAVAQTASAGPGVSIYV
jgi:flagellar hook-length control protein FliK